jgi:hypothetical protein
MIWCDVIVDYRNAVGYIPIRTAGGCISVKRARTPPRHIQKIYLTDLAPYRPYFCSFHIFTFFSAIFSYFSQNDILPSTPPLGGGGRIPQFIHPLI